MHLDIRGSETSCKNVLSKKEIRRGYPPWTHVFEKPSGEEGIKMEEELQYLFQKECSDTDDPNVVSNEAVEQPSEDANGNEDDE